MHFCSKKNVKWKSFLKREKTLPIFRQKIIMLLKYCSCLVFVGDMAAIPTKIRCSKEHENLGGVV